MKNIFTNSVQKIQPTIIAMADATHYLVGAIDQANNFVGLQGDGQAIKMNSLQQAKQYLRDNNIEMTTIEYQSAYDEMCGSSMSFGRCSQTIAL